jgi:DNA repair protein RecO (recombination protein O)
MQENKLRGIVLTSMRYGEQQRIVKILTRSHGLLSFIIRTERGKKKGSKAAFFSPFTILDVDAILSQKSSLHKIRECSLAISTAQLHQNHAKAAQAMFLSELIAKSLKEEAESEPMFDYLQAGIEWLNAAQDHGGFHIAIAIGLTGFLGFYPQAGEDQTFFDMREGYFAGAKPLHADCLTGRSAELFHSICGMNLDAISNLKLSVEDKNGVLNDVLVYYRIQLEDFKELNSHLILRETFH